MAWRVRSSWVGPEPAAADHGVAAIERDADRLDDPVDVVADLRLEVGVDACESQLLTDPRRVGVDDLAQQELGADGDHFTAHPREATGAANPGRSSRHRTASTPLPPTLSDMFRRSRPGDAPPDPMAELGSRSALPDPTDR